MMLRTNLSILLLLLFLATPSLAQKPDQILIGAASDLKFALDSIITLFNQKDGRKVNVTYGSSGKLFEQISNGAPFDLYFSADISYPNLLKERGFSASEVYPYGIGRIVLWSKRLDPGKDGMNTLRDPSIRKVAIANPEHAPYGMRAREALQYFQLWDGVKEQLVLGENISQAAQFVTSGASDIGIVALSLALSPMMKKMGGNYYLIPDTSHQPLIQGAIITRDARDKPLAKAFFDFVKGSQSQEILAFFGFTKP